VGSLGHLRVVVVVVVVVVVEVANLLLPISYFVRMY
jgi:hypothetical protein